ncbi:MAG: NAD-dependent epimerase/dehydratase family protein [Alphaproteobacteria bacterium]|nr:NAD-dependent epimerase/dehydratase family protein [Alphaproteobacteria bacterium]
MTDRKLDRVAVTGGAGFLGGALITRLIDDGVSVAALARTPAKLSRFDGQIDIVPGDLADETAIARAADGADAVLHLAALTHARTRAAFGAANIEGSANVARGAFAAGAFLVAVSSIAARQPELSDYAASKAGGEAATLAAARAHDKRMGAETNQAARARWAILRAPALYGPNDGATLPLLKAVRFGIAPAPAHKPAPRASILYVDDMAAAIVSAAREAPAGVVYDVGDERPEGRTWAEIAADLGVAMGRKPLVAPMPKPLLLAQAAVQELIAHARGEAAFVSRGKIREFFHPDWVAGEPSLAAATSWAPTTPLVEGFAKTLKWYQERGLI